MNNRLSGTSCPLVSICIPAYNAEKTLGQTLESMLQQDYPNCEVLVSDNHSTDATSRIALSYANRGVRHCTPPERPDWAAGMPSYAGAYVNANYVLSQGRGEFLCLFHADDVYHPQIVSKQVALASENPSVGAVFAMSRTIGENGRPIRMRMGRLPNQFLGRQVFGFDELFNMILSFGNFLPTPSAMIRRTIYETVGGFDEKRFLTSADLEMWLRIARLSSIGVIDEPLLNYRVHAQQYSMQYNSLRTTPAHYFLVMDAFLSSPGVRLVAMPDALDSYQAQRAVDDVHCAMNMLLLGQVQDAETRLGKALEWRYLRVALLRPWTFVRLTIGAGLLACSRLGLGTQAASALNQVYGWRLRWLWQETEMA